MSTVATATAATQPAAAKYLSINNIEVIYDHVILVLKGVSLEVPEGRIVALLGANGAGKSTTLKSISNLLAAERGDVTKGTIEFKGKRVDKLTTNDLVRMGVCQVMEGRHCFQHLTVEENLLTGAYRGRPGPWSLEAVYELFPWMPDRRRQNAAQLSGGEQQSVAIGRALLSNPDLLLIDELSLGLAPVIVRRIYGALRDIVAAGTTALIVEQDVSQAMRVADRVNCLLEGRSVLAGRPAELSAEQVERAYFGIRDGED